MYEEINEFIQKLIIEIPEIKIYKWEKDEDGAVHFYGELIIEKVYCPNCNSITKNVVKYYPRKVRHSPICEKPTYLHFEMREYQCEKCGSCFRQPLQFLSLYKHFTNDYINYIKKLLKETNIAWVARFENLEYHIVKRIAEKEIPASIKDNTDNLEKISIDEISQKKGYKNFRTIISNLKAGKIVDILKDRTKETVKEWFKNLGKEKIDKIKSVCIDMCKTFSEAIKEVMPHAKVVIDKFHIINNLNKAVNKQRRAIVNELTEEIKEKLKGIRWTLIKRKDNLTENEKEKLKEIYRIPELKLLHKLIEKFRKIFEEVTDKEIARREIKKWKEEVNSSGLIYMIKFVETITNWEEEILNYFDERITNGRAEGINNKIKLIKRRGYGYSNFNNFRNKILFDTS